MTNEQRRSFANLMLLCFPHHKATDNSNKYPVAALQKMKAEHEAKFMDLVQVVRNSVSDHKTADIISYPTTLAGLIKFRNWHLDEDLVQEHVESASRLAETIQDLPRDIREFLAVVIKRAREESMSRRIPMFATCREVDSVCCPGASRLEEYVTLAQPPPGMTGLASWWLVTMWT